MVKLKNEIKKMIFTYRKQNHTIKEIIYLLSEELNVKVSASTISRVLKEKLGDEKENDEEDEKKENEEEEETTEEEEETKEEVEEEETKEETADEEETEKNNNSIIDLLNKWKNEELILKEEPPKLKIKPFNKKNNKKNNDEEYDINENNNNILDTLKNVNSGNIDELKLKRSNIIIIRQYLNTFKNDLTGIYGKDIKGFQKKLFSFNNDQLLIILENIRVE